MGGLACKPCKHDASRVALSVVGRADTYTLRTYAARPALLCRSFQAFRSTDVILQRPALSGPVLLRSSRHTFSRVAPEPPSRGVSPAPLEQAGSCPAPQADAQPAPPTARSTRLDRRHFKPQERPEEGAARAPVSHSRHPQPQRLRCATTRPLRTQSHKKAVPNDRPGQPHACVPYPTTSHRECT